MSKRKEHHVVPKDGGWAVKKSGAKRTTKNFENKSEAVDFARDISKNQGSELIIHGRDGKIQKADSHGKDPIPPKDKK
jgi:uncharacterized protein YdaT